MTKNTFNPPLCAYSLRFLSIHFHFIQFVYNLDSGVARVPCALGQEIYFAAPTKKNYRV